MIPPQRFTYSAALFLFLVGNCVWVRDFPFFNVKHVVNSSPELWCRERRFGTHLMLLDRAARPPSEETSAVGETVSLLLQSSSLHAAYLTGALT